MSAKSKPTKDQIKRQIGRLAVFETSFPKTTGGVQELIDTLYGVAHTEDHARRLVDNLAVSYSFCPTPGDILRAAKAVPATQGLPDGCENCKGEAWVYNKPETAVGRCLGVPGTPCARGRFLLDQDRQRRSA